MTLKPDRTRENDAQLQELYLLDRGTHGTVALAWYAQYRALDYDHYESMRRAADKMGFTDEPWYLAGRALHAERRLVASQKRSLPRAKGPRSA